MNRIPQLRLRLDAATPDDDARWQAGASVSWLGRSLTLVLDTASPAVMRIGAELHAPLPPAATKRQIRDAVESWLRDEALRVFSEMSARAGRQEVAVTLSFGKRSHWACLDNGQLRCHWRLIEQPEPVVDQVIRSALARLAARPACDDLFALA